MWGCRFVPDASKMAVDSNSLLPFMPFFETQMQILFHLQWEWDTAGGRSRRFYDQKCKNDSKDNKCVALLSSKTYGQTILVIKAKHALLPSAIHANMHVNRPLEILQVLLFSFLPFSVLWVPWNRWYDCQTTNFGFIPQRNTKVDELDKVLSRVCRFWDLKGSTVGF